jgi:hypothetical protein
MKKAGLGTALQLVRACNLAKVESGREKGRNSREKTPNKQDFASA